jgi:hypothetical protein
VVEEHEPATKVLRTVRIGTLMKVVMRTQRVRIVMRQKLMIEVEIAEEEATTMTEEEEAEEVEEVEEAAEAEEVDKEGVETQTSCDAD